MRTLAAVLFVGGILAVASFGTAQPPEGPKGGKNDKVKGDKGTNDNKGDKNNKGGFNKGPGQFGPPPLGQILPAPVQEQLKLTDAQKKDLDAMQKDVDAKLDKLLTDEQKKIFKQMKERGPGRGPGNFPGGPPQGPGGNPPPPPPPEGE
jgi:hypothetical protein